ncbi:serine/threonine protein kinase [Nonomuraea glycinis]|nr:serine/threonine-protein kinase [Nonomuraea glycinis]MCA2180361.1 serine/threonine protein kinase [Nonomuraea glycinis]
MHRRVIDDRFELVERLGGGGMGLVWRAWDTALHREVALMEVRPPDPAMAEHDPATVRELRERVLREARALARLNHPHVVTIHHIVDEGPDNYPWLVMELVNGGSLQDRLARGPMAPGEAARLGREVLSALRAAHAVGIQHRDVKPANVLLRQDGQSVLTDFGIAAIREFTGLTATGAFIGSPEYMAPERINGYEGDPASDLWSLGMLLYVAVEGRHPLRRATTMATLAAVLNQDVPTPERAGPLGPVLLALLRRHPPARPDPDSLDRMLASAAAGGPLLPGPPPPGWGLQQQPIPHATTMPSRRPRRGMGALIAGVSAVGVAAVVTAGALVWAMLPPAGIDPEDRLTGLESSADAGESRSKPPAERTEQAGDPEGADDPENPRESENADAAPENLLTPTGVRAMIKTLRPVIGGSKVVRMVVYPTYASVDAPVKGKKGVFDRFYYREGVASRQGPGGTIDANMSVMDLSTFNWNVLPGLVRRANKELGVAKPTARYLIVNPGFAFDGSQTALMVYVSDEYSRSGYLAADRAGRVLRKVKAS